MIDSHVGKACSVEPVGNTTAATQRVASDFRSDADLEAAIEAAKQRLYAATTWNEKLVRWREWVRLIDQRSVHRARFLARMEQMQSPPSTSLGKAQATGECRGNAAGGVP